MTKRLNNKVCSNSVEFTVICYDNVYSICKYFIGLFDSDPNLAIQGRTLNGSFLKGNRTFRKSPLYIYFV